MFKNIKIEKVLGIAFIVLALVFAGFTLKDMLTDSSTPPDEQQGEENRDETMQIQGETEEDSKEEVEGDIEDQIQSEDTIKKIDTDIRYRIPKEIKAELDFEAFDAAFSTYLEDNMLMTENTKATSDEVLTYNFDKNYMSFNLRLNNYARSTVVCVMDLRSGDFDFTHY